MAMRDRSEVKALLDGDSMNFDFMNLIEETGERFALMAQPNYWAFEDRRRAQYYAKQLPHLRAMWRAAKSRQDKIACDIFKKNFSQVSDCMALANAVRDIQKGAVK